jgi:hypothetical protein
MPAYKFIDEMAMSGPLMARCEVAHFYDFIAERVCEEATTLFGPDGVKHKNFLVKEAPK